jgi:pimeloyl-ACP methyl ester carboxylesterase
MKIYMFGIRVYYQIMGRINPKLASERAFRLFQRTRNLKFKKRELAFYQKAHHFTARSSVRDINCYEMGDPNGPLVFLVHGWESNAGSMAGIGYKMADKGFHVVSMDLPAHGHDNHSHTNLFECKEALLDVIDRVWPSKPFSVISHSFGSAVTTFALSERDFKIDQLIYLTSPNELSAIFEYFKDLIHLPQKPFELIIEKVNRMFGEGIVNLTVQEKAKEINYNHLTMIHDKNDKVLPYIYSQKISNYLPRTELYTLENAGHYRMLWNDEVHNRISLQFPEAKQIKVSIAQSA